MADRIFLFLDFDGTLAPISKTPALARLSPQRRKLLLDISKKKNIKTVIVSGRRLKDLYSKVRIPAFHYVGNHGFEIDQWVHPGARSARKNLIRIFSLLKRRLNAIKGVLLEDKIYTISVHYRRIIGRMSRDILFKRFDKIIRPFIGKKKIRVTRGKEVLEIRPPVSWGKGDAVRRILSKIGPNPFPIYIGDDSTDEDAFLALKDKGLTIFVGKNRNRRAQINLPSIDRVYKFLAALRIA